MESVNVILILEKILDRVSSDDPLVEKKNEHRAWKLQLQSLIIGLSWCQETIRLGGFLRGHHGCVPAFENSSEK
jgi:hypothetical protein